MSTAGTARSKSSQAGGTALSIALAALIAAVTASIGNSVVALVAGALGVSAPEHLSAGVFIPLTVVGAFVATVGWYAIRRLTSRPLQVLRWVVPTVLAVSWIGDVVVGTELGWAVAVALGLMHVVVAAAVVLTCRRVLPLSR